MAMQEHIESLRSKHARLEQLISEEQHRPMPDQSTLSRLKKEKLKLKEAIEARSLSAAAMNGQAH